MFSFTFYASCPGRCTIVGVLVAASVLMPAFPVRADEPVTVVCSHRIVTPHHGATNVPLHGVIRGTTGGCTPTQPIYVTESGTAVAATIAFDDESFTLTPDVPLAPDTGYRVDFASGSACGTPPGRVVFSTGATPGMRRVTSIADQGRLFAVSILLTEPVADAADLSANAGFVSMTVVGQAAPALNTSAGTELSFSFKGQTTQPKVGTAVTVTLRKGLAFASGASLKDDIEIRFISKDHSSAIVYQAGGSLGPCDTSSGGCSAAPVSTSSRSVLLGLMLGMLWLAGRRRFGCAQVG
jgi:hypothetical protein